jgi:hypothetical protein
MPEYSGMASFHLKRMDANYRRSRAWQYGQFMDDDRTEAVMNVALLSIDLAKNIFQLYGVDERGQPVLSRRVSRQKLLESVISLPYCRIVIEACGARTSSCPVSRSCI